jgi:hypothetical protein
MCTDINRIAELAKEDPKRQFFSIAHLITGVIEDGRLLVSETGTGQGQPISYAVENAKKQGKKPETFAFLGFTHIGARSRQGKFTVHVKTLAKRFRRGLKATADWCKQHRHDPVSEQQKMLNAKLRGHYQYYGRPTNYRSLWLYYRKVRRIWCTWLSRRTRGTTLTWDRFAEILRQYPLLRPRITHSWAGAGSHA